jgi:hypothetical protein
LGLWVDQSVTLGGRATSGWTRVCSRGKVRPGAVAADTGGLVLGTVIARCDTAQASRSRELGGTTSVTTRTDMRLASSPS